MLACICLETARGKGPWEEWIPASSQGQSVETLRARFRALQEGPVRNAAGLHLLMRWPASDREAALSLLADVEVDLQACFTTWVPQDFDAALARAEQLDGFHGSEYRPAIFQTLAQKDPLGAAKRMRTQLDPGSKSYYYYVLIHGLVPALKEQSAATVEKALLETTSHRLLLDDFRWQDALRFLAAVDVPWSPPDWEADWRTLSARASSPMRDDLLGALVTARLSQDFDAGMQLPVGSIDPNRLDDMLQYGWPPDSAGKFPGLLGKGHPRLMRLWLRSQMTPSYVPDWTGWAGMALAIPDETDRRRAIETVAGAWAEHEPQNVRAWLLTLSSAEDRAVALAATLEAILPGLEETQWSESLTQMRTLPPGKLRDRCLEAWCSQAGKIDAGEVQKLVHELTVDDPVRIRCLDAALLHRAQHTENVAESLALTLGLRSPIRRVHEVRIAIESSLPDGGSPEEETTYQALRQAVEQAPLPSVERNGYLQDIILAQVYQQLSTEAGTASAFRIAATLASPEVRHAVRRTALRTLAEKDLAAARRVLETSALNPSEKAVLLKEWEVLSFWRRSPSSQN